MDILTGEVIDIKDEFKSYREFKEKFDGSLNMQAEAFVLTGYLIKRARDTDVLKESGYKDYNEFAAAEYGLDKSQVSRYIGINDQFSEGGYSDRLQERYKNFGYTKLAIMLTLPAAVNKELTADYSKQEILTLKAEIDEEKQRTDIEVMLEEKDERQREYTPYGKFIFQLGHNDPQMYIELYNAVSDKDDGTDRFTAQKMYDVLAPAGEAVISVRIPGEGRKLLCIKGLGECPVIIDARTGEKNSISWDNMIRQTRQLCAADDPEESWKILYGEEFPEKKTEVAPVQPDSGAKLTSKKPSRVTVSKPQTPKKTKEDNSLTQKTEEKTTAQKEEEQSRDEIVEVAPAQQSENGEDTAPPDNSGDAPKSADAAPAAGTGDGSLQGDAADDTGTTEEPPAAVLTEQIDGQMEIADFPENMPDNTAVEQKQKAVAGYLIALKDNLDKVYILTERGEYQNAEKWLEAVKGTIYTIRDISEAMDG